MLLTLPRCPEWKGETHAYCQVKRDGIQCHAGNMRVFTRHPTEITEACKYVPTLQNAWRRLPRGVIVVGELYVPGYPASEVKSALANDPKRLRFEAFATSSLDPMAKMEDLSLQMAQYGFLMVPLVNYPAEPFGPLPEDVEGYVFKDTHLTGWAKWKPVKTIDLIVVDTLDGTGKFLGYIGSLVCATYNGPIVAHTSGMTDLERAEMTLDSPIGRVVEVAYQYVGAKGRLRHPRFVRFRDDKRPAQCGLWQDPFLEKYYGDK